MKPPTRAQKRVLEAFSEYRDMQGHPPTVRDLCVMTGLSSTSTVHAHLRELHRKGLIVAVRDEGAPLRYDLPGDGR